MPTGCQRTRVVTAAPEAFRASDPKPCIAYSHLPHTKSLLDTFRPPLSPVPGSGLQSVVMGSVVSFQARAGHRGLRGVENSLSASSSACRVAVWGTCGFRATCEERLSERGKHLWKVPGLRPLHGDGGEPCSLDEQGRSPGPPIRRGVQTSARVSSCIRASGRLPVLRVPLPHRVLPA